MCQKSEFYFWLEDVILGPSYNLVWWWLEDWAEGIAEEGLIAWFLGFKLGWDGKDG